MLEGHSTRKINMEIVLLMINLLYFNSTLLLLPAKIILRFEFISCLELFQSTLPSINISGNIAWWLFWAAMYFIVFIFIAFI